MRKICSVLTSIMMLIVLCGNSLISFAAITENFIVNIADAKIQVGTSSVEVPIYVGADDLSALVLDIAVPSGLNLTDIKTTVKDVQYNKDQAIIFYSSSTSDVNKFDVKNVFATLVFEVMSTAKAGDVYPIGFKTVGNGVVDIDASNSSGQIISPTYKVGSVAIEDNSSEAQIKVQDVIIDSKDEFDSLKTVKEYDYITSTIDPDKKIVEVPINLTQSVGVFSGKTKLVANDSLEILGYKATSGKLDTLPDFSLTTSKDKTTILWLKDTQGNSMESGTVAVALIALPNKEFIEATYNLNLNSSSTQVSNSGATDVTVSSLGGTIKLSSSTPTTTITTTTSQTTTTQPTSTTLVTTTTTQPISTTLATTTTQSTTSNTTQSETPGTTTPASSDDLKFEIEKVKISESSQIQMVPIKVMIDKNPGISGAKFRFNLPVGMKIESISDGIFEGAVYSDNTVVWMESDLKNISENGTLFTIIVSVPAGISSGTYPITFGNFGAEDIVNTEYDLFIPKQLISGEISIETSTTTTKENNSGLNMFIDNVDCSEGISEVDVPFRVDRVAGLSALNAEFAIDNGAEIVDITPVQGYSDLGFLYNNTEKIVFWSPFQTGDTVFTKEKAFAIIKVKLPATAKAGDTFKITMPYSDASNASFEILTPENQPIEGVISVIEKEADVKIKVKDIIIDSQEKFDSLKTVKDYTYITSTIDPDKKIVEVPIELIQNLGMYSGKTKLILDSSLEILGFKAVDGKLSTINEFSLTSSKDKKTILWLKDTAQNSVELGDIATALIVIPNKEFVEAKYIIDLDSSATQISNGNAEDVKFDVQNGFVQLIVNAEETTSTTEITTVTTQPITTTTSTTTEPTTTTSTTTEPTTITTVTTQPITTTTSTTEPTTTTTVTTQPITTTTSTTEPTTITTVTTQPITTTTSTTEPTTTSEGVDTGSVTTLYTGETGTDITTVITVFAFEIEKVKVNESPEAQTVPVKVIIHQNPGMAAARFHFNLPEGMKIESVSDGILSGVVNSRENNTVVWMEGNAQNISQNGTMFTLNISIPAGMAPGTYPITFDDFGKEDVVSTDYTILNPKQLVDGKIEIIALTPTETTVSTSATTTASETTVSTSATTTASETTVSTSATTTASETTITTVSDTTPSETTITTVSDTTPSETTITTVSDTTPSETTVTTVSDTTASETTITTVSETTPSETSISERATIKVNKPIKFNFAHDEQFDLTGLDVTAIIIRVTIFEDGTTKEQETTTENISAVCAPLGTPKSTYDKTSFVYDVPLEYKGTNQLIADEFKKTAQTFKAIIGQKGDANLNHDVTTLDVVEVLNYINATNLGQTYSMASELISIEDLTDDFSIFLANVDESENGVDTKDAVFILNYINACNLAANIDDVHWNDILGW